MNVATGCARVAIAGAGIGGLACARALQARGLSVSVHERESGPHDRRQGGMLDLHVPTGQAALRAAGLFEQFRALARPEGQELRNLDPTTGALIHHELPTGGDGGAPEIDRGQLRGLLLDSLRPGTVRWGQALTAVTPVGDGTVSARFDDDTTAEFDLVIGADGAWSRVRPALSHALPAYWGSLMIETYLDDVETRHHEIAQLVGLGTLVAKRGRTMLSAQRNSADHIRVYVGLDAPADWPAGSGTHPTDDDLQRHVLGRLHGWNEQLLGLLHHRDGPLSRRPLHLLPTGHRWPHVPGLTLLGDAAHLMPPYGIGANLALIDGTDLAEAIAGHADLDQAIRSYEARMLPRATAAARACAELTDVLSADSVHDVDAARERLRRSVQHAEDGS